MSDHTYISTSVKSPMDRIEQVIKLGLVKNEAEWIRLAGLSTGYFSSAKKAFESGKRDKFGFDGAKALAAVVGLSPQWIMDGTGPMQLGTPTEPIPTPQVSKSAVTYVETERDLFARLIAGEARPGLRLALTSYLARHTNKDQSVSGLGRYVLTHFLDARWSTEVETEEQWAADIKSVEAKYRNKYVVGGARDADE
jgi:hypothetical protein